MSDHIEVRTADVELAKRSFRAAGIPFSFDLDDEELGPMVAGFDLDRFVVPLEDGNVIGSAGSIAYQATVPGGRRLPTGGVTFVTVLPTHRRRGVLRRMMRKMLDDARTAGEPLSTLWASEATIYGRFGYGQAIDHITWTLDSTKAAWRTERPPGRPRLISHEDAARLVPPMHEAACVRHGMLGREPSMWTGLILRDEEWMKRGFGSRRIVVWEGDGGLEGYGFFRTKLGSPGRVRVDEFHTMTPGAYRGLVEFFATIDLTDQVIFERRPPDEPMRWMLVDSRALKPTGSEFMWYRLLDVPAALAARTYAGSGTLVLEVTDAFYEDNDRRWRLEVSDGIATCDATDDPADVMLDVSELGSLYMGGRSALTSAKAERIHGSQHSVRTLDGWFRTETPPWSGEDF